MNFTVPKIRRRNEITIENFTIPVIHALMINHSEGSFTTREKIIDTILNKCIIPSNCVRNALHKNDRLPLTEHFSDFGISVARMAGIITDANYGSGKYYMTRDAIEFIEAHDEDSLKDLLISNFKSSKRVDLVSKWRKANPRKTHVVLHKKNGIVKDIFTTTI